MEWVRAAGSFAAALVALALGLGLKDWVYKPKIKLSSADDDPSARMIIKLANGRNGGWVRIRVTNNGRATARNVVARILSIDRWDTDDGRWKPERTELEARALGWANTPAEERVDVPQSTSRPLDLFSVIDDPHNVPAAALEMKIQIFDGQIPSTLGHQFTASGSWRIGLVLAADNVRARTSWVSVGFTAEWNAANLWVDTVQVRVSDARPESPIVALTSADRIAAALAEDNNVAPFVAP